MPEEQIKMLATGFEIGGHGLQHVRLHSTDIVLAEKEIKGSYNWLTDLLGYKPVSFCFPGGVYNQITTNLVFDSGYKLARTTEFFSTASFSVSKVTATTLQAYPHSGFTYTMHLVKRRRWTTLLGWLKNNSETNLGKLAEYYLAQVSQSGGCFHLWGHSWEIEKYQLWNMLEELFKIIANRTDFMYVQNKALIEN